MTKETQDCLWAVLSKDEREEIKRDYNSYALAYHPFFNEGYQEALETYFGHHNITSNEEPSELLFVERKKVQEYFATEVEINHEAQDSKDDMLYQRSYAEICLLKLLFGDKCLPDKPSNGAIGTTPPSDKLDVKSDKEPSVQSKPKYKVGELIMSEGKVGRVLEYDFVRKFPYLIHFPFNNSKVYRLESDLEPYTEPKYKIDDKVVVTHFNKVGIVRKIKPYPQIGFNYEVETGKDAYFIVHEVGLQPYTEPETKDAYEQYQKSKAEELNNQQNDNMKEKELNLVELLKGCEGETVFLVDEGYKTVYTVTDEEIVFYDKNSIGTIHFKGESLLIQPTGFAYAYPSKEAFLDHPLDARKAWQEWKSERTPKRWRAEGYEMYWYIDSVGEVIDVDDTCQWWDNARYKLGNYFKDEHTAKQAVEVVRECLAKFHEQNVKK